MMNLEMEAGGIKCQKGGITAQWLTMTLFYTALVFYSPARTIFI